MFLIIGKIPGVPFGVFKRYYYYVRDKEQTNF